MFLADAVANYVSSLTERSLDAPLLALLHREGFEKVHLVHGGYEFGKDIIAQRTEEGGRYQYCIQSKAGNIGQSGWREVRSQIEEMRTGSAVHPNFNPQLPRRLILAFNGRLTGTSAISLQEYNQYHLSRSEAAVEVWDLENLAARFEVFLVEGVPAQDRARTLELLGRISLGEAERSAISTYAQKWFVTELSPTERWGHRLTGAMLASEASNAGREDLASHIAFSLMSSSRLAVKGDPDELEWGRGLYATYASDFWLSVRAQVSSDLLARKLDPVVAFVVLPIRAVRLAEYISMYALYRAQVDGELPGEIVEYLVNLVESTPSTAMPVSDEWAFSVLAVSTVLNLAQHNKVLDRYLRRNAVWLLDKLEFGDGLAEVGESPSEIVGQLLGAPYKSLRRQRNSGSYLATVLLDACLLSGNKGLFKDLLNDLTAVDAYAKVVYDKVGEGPQPIVRLEYTYDDVPAPHYEGVGGLDEEVANGLWLDCFAAWSLQRDRHSPAAIETLLRSHPRPTISGT